MRKYIFTISIFIVVKGFGALVYKLLGPYLMKDYLSLIMRLFFAVVFIVLTFRYIKDKKPLFTFGKISRTKIWICLFVTLLFAVNNFFLATFSTKTEFMENSILELVALGFVINSFYEEFAYRGFIQNYINQSENISFPISKGNLFASILMLFSHAGFFMVMDSLFAITGLILVFIFSLSVGYIRDKGASIWFLIVFHTTINFIHLIINIEHYT